MSFNKVISWLLEGDVSIQYQVHRYLLSTERKDLQDRIASEGWGAQFLSKRNNNGHWGQGYYQPKWISSHYTLLDLRNLCIAPDQPLVKESVNKILRECKAEDGGIYPIVQKSDVCVNGMFLNFASYFGANEESLESVVDCLLAERMPDGGYNCRSNRSGARHSSLHTTISVLEGINSYKLGGYHYRLPELLDSQRTAREFILLHQLYISDKTGSIIDRNFLKFPYPSRWKYDILRALDYFQQAELPQDKRLTPALDYLLDKQNKDGTWNLNAKHPGQLHFEMEKAGKPSRWNTLRALRVLKRFDAGIAADLKKAYHELLY
ncbi:MAG: hypothetical protein HEP71_18575 [Roseivirga sp.]|nr:hypothetical protein [Roseivirga sp.]